MSSIIQRRQKTVAGFPVLLKGGIIHAGCAEALLNREKADSIGVGRAI